ncbi:MAG TPA: hypothetical protein VKU41_04795 [Polyangiaceae bacterium]|nr:hypothetical protein [Polyangiaceae bacterium]
MRQRAALELLDRGLAMTREAVRHLIDLPDPEEWIDQKQSPLGVRRHCELARAGLLTGARKHGGRWYVKRKHLDAYLDAQEAPNPEHAEQAQIMAFRARPTGRRKAGR